MFGYDQKAPLDLQETGVETRDSTDIHDISYSHADGSRVAAYLVTPSREGTFAGIIFLHGGGQDRSAFLDEALSWAKLGAVSLLIDEPSVRAMPHFTEPQVDRDRFIQIVLKLRRGVDLLTSRPNINPGRIGYIGLSFGAWMGGVLSGIEERVKAYVLIAGMPSMTDFWRSHQHPAVAQIRESLSEEQMESYLRTTAPLDAIHYISHAAPSAVLFQFAERDAFISQPAALKYVQAASEPKLVRWYSAQHAADAQISLSFIIRGPCAPLMPGVRRHLLREKIN